MDSADARTHLAEVVRAEGRIVLATLVRLTGDLVLAEDAVQDAALAAMTAWEASGPPPNARAWLIVTAKHRAIDLLRRERARLGKEVEAMEFAGLTAPEPPSEPSVIADDRLRLIFLCCHPALDVASRVALSLRVLGGLEVAEIADALLVSEAAMAKRLTRARSKIRDAQIPYRVPSETELPERLDTVAAVLLLIFNEGYASRRSGGSQRVDLATEAIRLGRALREVMPGEAIVEGLLATMLLQQSRRAAREVDGELVLLADQDRRLWDHRLIAEGTDLAADAVGHSAARGTRFAVMAAIAALQATDAPDRAAIVDWYDVLVTFDPSPVVKLNRAAAVAESLGAADGLAAVEAVVGLDDYPWFHASRGELLLRVGRPDDAADAFARAIALFGAADEPVVRHLERRRASALTG